jgi:hypothetical protein
MRTRDKKKRENERKRKSTRHVTMGAPTRLSVALRGSLQWVARKGNLVAHHRVHPHHELEGVVVVDS